MERPRVKKKKKKTLQHVYNKRKKNLTSNPVFYNRRLGPRIEKKDVNLQD